MTKENTIRPVMSIQDATALRDVLIRVVVYTELYNSFILDEEVATLRHTADKITALLMLAETRKKIRDLQGF